MPRSCGSFLLVPALTVPEVAMSRPAPGASQGIVHPEDRKVRCVRVVQHTAFHIGHRRIRQRAVGNRTEDGRQTRGTHGPIHRSGWSLIICTVTRMGLGAGEDHGGQQDCILTEAIVEGILRCTAGRTANPNRRIAGLSDVRDRLGRWASCRAGGLRLTCTCGSSNPPSPI